MSDQINSKNQSKKKRIIVLENAMNSYNNGFILDLEVKIPILPNVITSY